MALAAPKAITVVGQTRFSSIVTPVQVRIPESFPGYGHELRDTRALWDTGATHSVMDAMFASLLGIPPAGKVRTQGIHGAYLTNTFIVDILLPSNIAFGEVKVIEGEIGESAGLLIGMDLITQGDLALTHANGRSMFSFRYPPAERHIDFSTASVPNPSRSPR